MTAVTGPAAVLWDMDGTLVDTEPYWIEAEYALVAEHGGSWSDEHAHALIGNPLLVSAEYIRHHGGVQLPPEAIVQRLLGDVSARVRERMPWQPGARELLAQLVEAGVPNALVTMSWTQLASAVLEALPAGWFDVVVTGDEVTHGKPHPEPYLLAADRLGVDTTDCVAIEDSLPGLASAEAAGARTIAVPHLIAIPPAPGRVRVRSLQDVDLPSLAAVLRDVEQPAGAGVSEP
jgi:HAD superfamily hydrolase (TIGR01509 family)